MRTTTTRGLAALTLALTLGVLPTAALAGTSQTTTTTESLVAYNVAMVVPATGTYTQVPGFPAQYQYSLAVTGVATDSAAGLTVKVGVSALTGPATIPTTDRQLAATNGLSAGLVAAAAATTAYGTFLDSTTRLTLITSAGVQSAGSFTAWPTVRNIVTNGTYASSLTLVATSN